MHHYPEEDTLALSMGNLLHKVKELCSQSLINGQKPDYKALEDITLHTGWEGTDKASAGAENAKNEVILSVDKLKIKFFKGSVKG